eukprot:Filipodium_phascolosomae@DN882_c0_g1_i1.p1
MMELLRGIHKDIATLRATNEAQERALTQRFLKEDSRLATYDLNFRALNDQYTLLDFDFCDLRDDVQLPIASPPVSVAQVSVTNQSAAPDPEETEAENSREHANATATLAAPEPTAAAQGNNRNPEQAEGTEQQEEEPVHTQEEYLQLVRQQAEAGFIGVSGPILPDGRRAIGVRHQQRPPPRPPAGSGGRMANASGRLPPSGQRQRIFSTSSAISEISVDLHPTSTFTLASTPAPATTSTPAGLATQRRRERATYQAYVDELATVI